MCKKILSNSFLSYFFLAFISMTGLSYINFLPGLVNALAGSVGFGAVQAGQIVSVNSYGGLLGSIAAIFLVRRMSWRMVVTISLTTLVLIDLVTLWIEGYEAMLIWRFFAGTIGGLCVGITFSVLARLSNPDRAFGLLLFIQFSIGSLVIYVLPGLESVWGPKAVFGVMVILSLLAMTFLALLSFFDVSGSLIVDESIKVNSSNANTIENNLLGRLCFKGLNFRYVKLGNSLLLLLAIFAYQTAASGIWAYVGLIGLDGGIISERVSFYIAATGLLGVLGAMLPVVVGNRLGRLYWLIAGIVLSIAAALLLNFSALNEFSYIFSMALLFYCWPAVLSFLLAATAEMDGSGRLAAIAAAISFMGIASGPLFTSSVLGNGNFGLMLYSCAVIFLLSLFLLFKPVLTQEREH